MEISKQCIKGASWLLIAAYRKWEMKEINKRRIVKQKEPGLDDFLNSQTFQIY